jgi:hypothetical protein
MHLVNVKKESKIFSASEFEDLLNRGPPKPSTMVRTITDANVRKSRVHKENYRQKLQL